jgi:hypothetical protein
LLALLGRAHPVLLHAPLGVLPAIALLEFGSLLLRRAPPRGSVMALAWFNAVAAALATVSGLLLASQGYEGDTIGTHKVLGIVLGALSLVAAALSLLARRAPFRIALFAALVVMIPAGHLGGSLTHGADFLFPKSSAPFEGATEGGEFADTIVPILRRTCIRCHDSDKQKGELLLTTVEGIRKGGENGEVVVPGKPDESPLVLRCELPLDHDDHMPPAEKPQPTKEEIAALRDWVARGAKFD